MLLIKNTYKLKKLSKSILFILLIIFTLCSCVNYGALGLPRGINGHIMRIVPGATVYAYVESMYSTPQNITNFPDGSKNVIWLLDTSEGDCIVEVGFNPNGVVNWYNYTYKNAIKRRN